MVILGLIFIDECCFLVSGQSAANDSGLGRSLLESSGVEVQSK